MTADDVSSRAMLPAELDEIMKRHAASERGWHLVRDAEDPFHFTIDGDGPTNIATFGGDADNMSASYMTEENALFAVHAHSDVPRLVDEVKRLQAALIKGANSTDPAAILRLGLEGLRTNNAHLNEQLTKAQKERDAAQCDLDFLHRVTLPSLHRQVEFQKEGKERWRDRALAAETELSKAGEPND